MNKLIVSDLDNTLLNANHVLDVETIEVLQRLVEQGVRLVLASGRHYIDMKTFKKVLNVPVDLISANGAVVHTSDEKLLYQAQLSKDLIQTLIQLKRPPHVRLHFYTPTQWLVDQEDFSIISFHKASHFHYKVFQNFSDMDHETVNKAFMTGDPEALSQIESFLNIQCKGLIHQTYSLPNILEIMPLDTNKGTALTKLLKNLNCGAQQCLAFGDNLNDTEMLQLVHQPFVMSNANPELIKRIPNAQIIGRYDQLGVARELEKLFSSTKLN